MNRSARPRPAAVIALALCLLIAMTAGLPRAASAAAPTTTITVKKLAADEQTVLLEKTVEYRWLMDPDNIPVLGDGATHYYHQGPVFVDDPDESTEQVLRWNPGEDTNIKDMGALKGTNVRDLCELVGGMAPGDRLRVRASDGFSKTFAYGNVYQYSAREGPMVICWYKDGQYPDCGYREGMRLVWFADTSTNPWNKHVFGNWDWHSAAAEECWYYFHSGSERYPTTTGLSVQCVSELIIYSTEPATETPPAQPPDDPPAKPPGEETPAEPPAGGTPAAPMADFDADVTTGEAPLTVQFSDRSANSPESWGWDFDGDGTADSSAPNPAHTYDQPGRYTVRLTVGNATGSDEMVKVDWIIVNPAPAGEEPDPTTPEEGPEAEPAHPAGPDNRRFDVSRQRPLIAAAVILLLVAAIGIRRYVRHLRGGR